MGQQQRRIGFALVPTVLAASLACAWLAGAGAAKAADADLAVEVAQLERSQRSVNRAAETTQRNVRRSTRDVENRTIRSTERTRTEGRLQQQRLPRPQIGGTTRR